MNKATPKVSSYEFESTVSDSESHLFLKKPSIYKPFRYPFCFDAWKIQQQFHWIPQEIKLDEDIKDWKENLSPKEQNFLAQIFRFFTQMDIEVGNNYTNYYNLIFCPYEIRMMLASFANMETIHTVGYSYLLDSIGMPVQEYQAFLEYKEMTDKWNYMHTFGGDSVENVALTLAYFAGCVEGLNLFASFVMLLYFSHTNRMPGMGQIVAWSIRDETLHAQSMILLYHAVLAEHPHINIEALHTKVLIAFDTTISQEDKFIELAFAEGDFKDLTMDDVKRYIRYIANTRLEQLCINKRYDNAAPIEWVNDILNSRVLHDFFTVRGADYQKTTHSAAPSAGPSTSPDSYFS